MARFTVGGDEDGNEERPRNNRPSPPKRLRLSTTLSHSQLRNRDASISNSGDRANTSTATEVLLRPEPVAVREESGESSDESDTSWSHSSSESEGESDEEEHQNQRSSNEVQTTEARVNSTTNENGACRESEGPSAVSVTLADTDVLDCPICYEPLCSPVYQCENGHIACASCCTKLKNKCGSCCWPIGYNRCRAMEKVLESARIACQNMSYGCTETLSYNKKQAHENTCDYAPCSCPFTGCNYVAISKYVYSHFALKHSTSSKRFIMTTVLPISLDNTQNVFLQDISLGTLFILNRSIETVGSFVDVVCIGPTSETRPFLYELTAIAGESSIKLKTFVECVPKLAARSPKRTCLVVPREFVSIDEPLKLELIIRRNLTART